MSVHCHCGGDHEPWQHPETAYDDAMVRAARLIIEARDRSLALAADVERRRIKAGHAYDTRVQFAEGSASAYAYAGSVIAACAGAPNVEALAGEWTRDDGSDTRMERPTLPSELTDAPAPFVDGDGSAR